MAAASGFANLLITVHSAAELARAADDATSRGLAGSFISRSSSRSPPTPTRATSLFFRQPVTPEQMKKVWDIYRNNFAARNGFLLSFLGLLVPGVALISRSVSRSSVSRASNPDARPPIGRRGQAIAGVVLSVIGCAYTAAIVVAVVLRA